MMILYLCEAQLGRKSIVNYDDLEESSYFMNNLLCKTILLSDNFVVRKEYKER